MEGGGKEGFHIKCEIFIMNAMKEIQGIAGVWVEDLDGMVTRSDVSVVLNCLRNSSQLAGLWYNFRRWSLTRSLNLTGSIVES